MRLKSALPLHPCNPACLLSPSHFQELEDDVVALMRKRVYDVAGVLGKTVKVGMVMVHTFALLSGQVFGWVGGLAIWLVDACMHALVAHGTWPFLLHALVTPSLTSYLVKPINVPPGFCLQPTGCSTTPPFTPPNPQVYLNGVRLPVKSFQDYCELYLGPKDAAGVPRVYERVNDR